MSAPVAFDGYKDASVTLRLLPAYNEAPHATLVGELAPLAASAAIVSAWIAIVLIASIGDDNKKASSHFGVLSLRTSWNELTTNAGGSYLDVIDIFRVTAIVWVIANHLGSEGRIDILEGLPSVAEFKSAVHNHPILGALLGNSALGVEIFLVLGGLLAARSWHRSASMPFFAHTLKFLVRRVFRLIPTIAVFIFLAAGPLMQLFLPRFHDTMIADCGVRGIAAHLTATANWLPTPTCLGYLWYISLDVQLYAMSPLILLALYRCPRIGAALIISLIAASIALRAVRCIQYDVCSQADVDIPFIFRPGTSAERLHEMYAGLWPIYSRPCTKAGPFLIGLALGFITANVKASFGIAKVRTTCALGALACLAIIYAVLPQYLYPNAGNSLYNIAYMACFRSAFALAIAAMLCALFYAAQRPSVAFAWSVAAKITFAVYLVHMPVVYCFNHVAWLQETSSAYVLLALVPFACIASFTVGFLFYMFVEAPLARISALILKSLF